MLVKPSQIAPYRIRPSRFLEARFFGHTNDGIWHFNLLINE